MSKEVYEYGPIELLESKVKSYRATADSYRGMSESFARRALQADATADEFQAVINQLKG